jgi:sugar phosphate isomerase/epimerase
MPSRRRFLTALAASLGASTVGPAPARGEGGSAPAIKSALNGPIGLQLWSLREYLPKDLPGTLVKVRGFGFEEVEGAGLWGHTARDLRSALETAGLHCRSVHMSFERLRDDPTGGFAEARTLGADWVVCPWIPQGSAFTRDDVLRAAEAFNRFGKAARAAGLRFAYHCHGYEFVPSTEGTLFDTLAGATDPALVAFQVDVFHAFNGGADPTRLIKRLTGRVPSLHLKDLQKGRPVKAGSPGAEAEADVPVGTGQIDWPAVLRAAIDAGASMYYLEDESPNPLAHIPQSLAYLAALRL